MTGRLIRKSTVKELRSNGAVGGELVLGKCVLGKVWRPTTERGAKPEGVWLISALRVAELETLIRHRHGGYVPDARGTDDLDLCHAYVHAVAGSLGEFVGWSRRWLPWMDDQRVFQSAEALRAKLAAAKRGPRVLPADAIARMVMVRLQERNLLGLKTIGASDVSGKERKALAKAAKLERDRERQRLRRKAEGRRLRAEIAESSLQAAKPWEVEGISRRTWFYRKRALHSSVANNDYNSTGDTPVQSIDPSSRDETTRPKGEVAGPGDKSPAGFQGAEPHGAVDEVAYG